MRETGVASAARRGKPAAVRKAAMPPLLASDPLRRGLRLLLDEGLEHLMRNEPGARTGRMEAVHQMRVALRRLRTVLKLFRGLLQPDGAAAIADELRRLGGVLGEARDWDVFCVEILPAVAAAEPGTVPVRGALRRAAAGQRRRAHAALREALATGELPALARRLAEWPEKPDTFRRDPGRTIGASMPKRLARLEQRVRRRGRDLAGQDDEARHQLRKALKTLRYGREMLRAIAERTTPPDGIARLQDALGGLNDAAAAEELARRLRDAARSGSRPGSPINRDVEAVCRWSGQHRAGALAVLPEGWERFAREGLRRAR